MPYVHPLHFNIRHHGESRDKASGSEIGPSEAGEFKQLAQAIALVAAADEWMPRWPLMAITDETWRRRDAGSTSSRENDYKPASATALSIRLATLSMHFLASPP